MFIFNNLSKYIIDHLIHVKINRVKVGIKLKDIADEPDYIRYIDDKLECLITNNHLIIYKNSSEIPREDIVCLYTIELHYRDTKLRYSKPPLSIKQLKKAVYCEVQIYGRRCHLNVYLFRNKKYNIRRLESYLKNNRCIKYYYDNNWQIVKVELKRGSIHYNSLIVYTKNLIQIQHRIYQTPYKILEYRNDEMVC